MPKSKSAGKPFVQYHKDGSVWARGQMIGEAPAGYWEWFRKDGTKLRSGHFEAGEQTGEWTTYDKKGEVYKVTRMKAKAKMNSDPRPPHAAGKQASGRI
jgi:antitoxin component YwqK of YwqJK toxin-antitoxin module